MASARTICTECKSVVTLPEPAEVGDVVTCPKCEAYFTVPKTKIVPLPGAAKPAVTAKPMAAVPAKPKPKAAVDDEFDFDTPPPKKKPVVVVEDDEDDADDEEEEKPKKKKKRPEGSGPKKKKKKPKDDEKSFKDSPVRYAILGVLVLVMLVGGYFLYKKMMKGDPPDIVVTKPDEDLSKPISKEQIQESIDKANKNKAGSKPANKPLLPSVNRNTALNDLKQLVIAYGTFADAMGRPPQSLAELLPFTENNEKLIKAVNDGVYVLLLNVNIKALPGGSSNTILAYVHDAPDKGGVVAFADGSVRNVTKAEFDAAPKAGK